MSTLLSDFTTISNWVFQQAAKVIDLITANPILLVPVAIFAIGSGVNFVKRLLSV